ncbi:UBA-e1-C domain-containing protein [Mycena venus]|uniref:UBA-e1-C domain-containing protein n=1 Tax=Mycena venus TaxID=2733690 RepID=A0A8H7CHM2_9AGAR|nr:UBA-e1-C domain-containing protein [Mycena venus]
MSYSPSSSSTDTQDTSALIPLVIGNLIPLHVVLAGLTWVLHDYLATVEDEIRYIWPQRLNFSKFMFFWIRYYTIALLLFDVIQIHVFARPGITSNNLCVAMDTIIRVVGAVSLWSVEIIMQLRVYALYGCSRRIAAINLILFAGSIVGFMWILIYNHSHRASVIASVIHLDLPGCPSVHSGIEWAQWVPATVYEGILFGFALFKTFETTITALRKDGTLSLHTILLRDNILYFFGIAALLVFNNLMVVNLTHIPWFSYGPFHAAVGIMTSRMVINIRKATSSDMMISLNSSALLQDEAESTLFGTPTNTVGDVGRPPIQAIHPQVPIGSMV